MLNSGIWTYTWQNGRQLAGMSKSGMAVSFKYNANGLRTRKIVNGVVTNYTLRGKNVVHMTNGNDSLHFFYDAQGKPAVVVYNGTAYAYVKNLQGDIIAILDSAGTAVVRYTYDAWGAPTSTTGTMAATLGVLNPFRYRGYVYDEETGLYYLRSRYYNSELLRFVNADTLLQPNFNLFGYCMQNPTFRIDPDGAAYFDQSTWDMISNRSFTSPLNIGSIAGAYRGNTADISSTYSVWKNNQAAMEVWINSPYNLPPSQSGSTVTPEKLKQFATEAAKQYVQNNPGSGAVYGTKGHTYVEELIKAQNWSNVDVEVSFIDKKPAHYGEKGSVRLDIVLFSSDSKKIPIYAIDLKFGITPLTQRRIDQINNHLPNPIQIDQVP